MTKSISFASCMTGNPICDASIETFTERLVHLANAMNHVSGILDIPCQALVEVQGEKIIISFVNSGKEAPKPSTTDLRKEWVSNHLAALANDPDVEIWKVNAEDREVVVARIKAHSQSHVEYNHYIARCSPQDKFDKEVGCAVAYAKACGEAIPDFI